ncbi:MAG: hypothetical protein ACE5HX_01520 [bacterium]
MTNIWKALVITLISALLGWGAWATMTVSKATPRIVHDKHVNDFNENKRYTNEKFERMQMRIEDKLDNIQEHLMENN